MAMTADELVREHVLPCLKCPDQPGVSYPCACRLIAKAEADARAEGARLAIAGCAKLVQKLHAANRQVTGEGAYRLAAYKLGCLTPADVLGNDEPTEDEHAGSDADHAVEGQG